MVNDTLFRTIWGRAGGVRKGARERTSIPSGPRVRPARPSAFQPVPDLNVDGTAMDGPVTHSFEPLYRENMRATEGDLPEGGPVSANDFPAGRPAPIFVNNGTQQLTNPALNGAGDRTYGAPERVDLRNSNRSGPGVSARPREIDPEGFEAAMRYGLTPEQAAIAARNPASALRELALGMDEPAVNPHAAGWAAYLARQRDEASAESLRQALHHPPSEADVNLAAYVGSDAAVSLLRASAQYKGSLAASSFVPSSVVESNRDVFVDAAGRHRSVHEVLRRQAEGRSHRRWRGNRD